MDTFWGLTSTAWTAIYTLLTAGLLITALLAALYAHRQWKISREQTEESRRAQLEAIRPYVVVTAPTSELSQSFFDLSIKNIGVRPARNVRVSLDPPPRRANEEPGWAIAETKMLNEPISLLAPGQGLSTHYDTAMDRKDRDDLPTSHRVHVTYEDLSGTKFEENMTIDLEALMGSLHADVKTVHNGVKELERIRKRLDQTSLLNKTAGVDVAAVVESYSAHHERTLRKSLETVRRFRPDDQSRIDRLEAEIAASETANRRESGRGGARTRKVRRLRSSATRR